MKNFTTLNRYLSPYKLRLVIAFALSFGASCIALAQPRLIKLVLESVQLLITSQTNGTTIHTTTQALFESKLALYCGLILLAAMAKGMVFFLFRSTILTMGNAIEYDLRNQLYIHYQKLAQEFYMRYAIGDLMSRMSEDINKIGLYLGHAIAYGMQAVTIFVTLVPFMLLAHTTLALQVLSPLLLLIVFIYLIGLRMYQHALVLQRRLATSTSFVQESITNMSAIQSFAPEASDIHAFTRICQKQKEASLHFARLNALFFPIVAGTIGLGILITIWWGGKAVIQGHMQPSDIAEFTMCLYALGWPIFLLTYTNKFTQKALASQVRLDHVLQQKQYTVSTRKLCELTESTIAFHKVDFRYRNTNLQALKQVSFKVSPGNKLAIVGAIGSGKSTIASLLCRFYEPQVGTIELGGKPLEDYEVATLRSQIGYVPQDNFLFSDTILNNLTCGDTTITKSDIQQALQEVELFEVIQALPQQLDTVLGERGLTFSGGQRQRLVLARALVRNPRILILDDCLSALDTKTERSILRTISQIGSHMTVIIVSHRVSVAHFADTTLVLHQGQVVEKGQFSTLLENKGLFHSMYYQANQGVA